MKHHSNTREMKKFIEAEAAFFARRTNRAIIKAARVVDPNSSFRLKADPAAVARLRAAAERYAKIEADNKAHMARLNKRDQRIAQRSVQAAHARQGI